MSDDSRITSALDGKLDTRRLSEEEEAVWLDAFTKKMAQPSEAEEALHARRRSLGRGVGLNTGGNLVYAKEGDAG